MLVIHTDSHRQFLRTLSIYTDSQRPLSERYMYAFHLHRQPQNAFCTLYVRVPVTQTATDRFLNVIRRLSSYTNSHRPLHERLRTLSIYTASHRPLSQRNTYAFTQTARDLFLNVIRTLSIYTDSHRPLSECFSFVRQRIATCSRPF